MKKIVSKQVLIFFALLGSFFLGGCADFEDLYFSNGTSDSLCAYPAVYADGPVFPDTILPDDQFFYQQGDITISETHTNLVAKYGAFEKNFLTEINLVTAPEIVSIFVISKDTLNKYSWDGVRESYNVLVRYDFTHKQLKNLGYTIPYPPSPQMRDMKMYPSYEKMIEKSF